jgi:hypothetical protein
MAEKLRPRWLLKAISRKHTFLSRLTGGRAFNTLGDDEVCFDGLRAGINF